MSENQLDYIFTTIIKVASILIRQNKFNYSNRDLDNLREEFKIFFPTE